MRIRHFNIYYLYIIVVKSTGTFEPSQSLKIKNITIPDTILCSTVEWFESMPKTTFEYYLHDHYKCFFLSCKHNSFFCFHMRAVMADFS